jgi:hypothetical protein
VLDLYLVASSHNAGTLEAECVKFFAVNYAEIEKKGRWRDFEKSCKNSAYAGEKALYLKIKKQLEETVASNYVSVVTQRLI